MEVDEVCPGVNMSAKGLGDEELVMAVPLVLPLGLLFLPSGLIVNVIHVCIPSESSTGLTKHFVALP
ncbi:hypothetical protein GUJ93_ZPchr0012g21216 [Zizania palustris]|uniref:Uncharacterized protein n=1 Tax=Zizania palustris TaxID=103762 RepID=A0A8J5WT88_ZIZPA|nr:hypothetical protein GUJ93_ZPchr0012g21216 [Zizania palustris]